MSPRALRRLRPALVATAVALAVPAIQGQALAATRTGVAHRPRPAHPTTSGHRTASGHRAAARHRGPAAHRGGPARPVDPRRVLAARVRGDLARATAGHVAFRFDVDGLGSLTAAAASTSAPASTMKVLTAQTALDRLGPDHRFQTRLVATAPPVAGLVDGDLVVVGGGDPVLRSAQLADLALQARRAGITAVSGNLVVDDSAFPQRTTARGWGRRFVPDELGPISAFAVDEDADRRDAGYVADPSLANAQQLADALIEAGVRVAGDVRHGRAPAPDSSAATTVGMAWSPPLSTVVAGMLTSSDNFVAEVLLDDLGVAAGTPSADGGLAAIAAECQAVACTPGRAYDGSGLSYLDRQSPDSLVGWLRASAASPVGQDLRDGLPVSCRTGTLRHRLCARGVAGAVHAKTGTLDHVRALAGYARTARGRSVVFSVMVSGVRSMLAAQRAIDAAVSDVVLRG